MYGIDPFKPVKDFEYHLQTYTGAPYAVAVRSCTDALELCCRYLRVKIVTIPKRTYVSIPQAIRRAGGKVSFEELVWSGEYQLLPYPIVDSARRFTGDMHMAGTFQCVSFHTTKILGHDQGGAILTDSLAAYSWFQRAKMDGRTAGLSPNEDDFTMLGMHCYMSPGTAAELSRRLSHLPFDNPDLPNDDYPDLSRWDWNGMVI